MNLTPKNIQDYVVRKVLENFEERDAEILRLQKSIESLKNEIKEKDKKIKRMSIIFKDNSICYECVCSRCRRKIPNGDTLHSHNAHPVYSILCYRCFFNVL